MQNMHATVVVLFHLRLVSLNILYAQGINQCRETKLTVCAAITKRLRHLKIGIRKFTSVC